MRQHWPARFVIVPYNIGWHLAHHVDAGCRMAPPAPLPPGAGAPGYVAEGLEYASYPALWRALSSGPARPATAAATS